MSLLQYSVNGLLNFLDEDRPCNLLYDEAMTPRDRVKTPQEMKESLAKFAQALKKCRPKNPRKHDLHTDYGVTIYTAFMQDLQYRTSDMMDRAVAQMKEAEKCWPASEKISTDYASFQTDFGNIYVDCYTEFKNLSDLGNALEAGQAALNSCPGDALRERVLALFMRGRAGCAHNESFATPTREQLEQPIKDLSEAIQVCNKDDNLNVFLPFVRGQLQNAYTLQYRATGRWEDFNQAVKHTQERFIRINMAEMYAIRYNAEMKTRSYRDPVAVGYLQKAMELLARAKETGNDDIKADCDKIEEQIQEFRRQKLEYV